MACIINNGQMLFMMKLLLILILAFTVSLIIKDDVKTRKVKNKYILGVIVISLFSVVFSYDTINQVLSSAVVFLAFFILWMARVIGGGDVKLVAALALGIQPDFILPYLVLIGLFGGIQVICIWLSIFPHRESGLPFTIPISISGLYFFSSTILSY